MQVLAAEGYFDAAMDPSSQVGVTDELLVALGKGGEGGYQASSVLFNCESPDY